MCYRLLLFLSLFTFIYSAFGQDPTLLPLYNFNDLVYEGAFRIPSDTYGPSSINYSEGPLAYNEENNSIFIVGHNHHQAIAEFLIPPVLNTTVITDLNMAGDPVQEYVQLLDRTPDNNPENINRIGGLYTTMHNGQQKLIVNGYEYYDAPADNTVTTLIADNATSLENSGVTGYFRFTGEPGHTSGWISPIPEEWQVVLNGTHITGQSSGIPIISRCSVGPSAFSFYMDDLLEANVTPVPTTTLLDFSLTNPLHEDLFNNDLDNDLWTHLSRATYGFIVPGTRTYLTIGYSGGHVSGVCYKCIQDDGNSCGGYCTPQAGDENQYYWLWDLNDLLKVKNGTLLPYEVRPYDYGEFNTPFQTEHRPVGGGSFDPATGNLYLSLKRADTEQGTYARPPIIVVYNTEASILPVELSLFEGKYKNGETLLTWVTQSEVNNKGFDLEYSLNGYDWSPLSFIPGAGNSSNLNPYEYLHRDPVGGLHYYRLKQIDFNGLSHYSSIISIEVPKQNVLTISPNPSTGLLNIKGSSYTSINIFDTWGRVVETITGNNSSIDISHLASGLYFIRVETDQRVITKKLIKE